jgi:hypothetical protein
LHQKRELFQLLLHFLLGALASGANLGQFAAGFGHSGKIWHWFGNYWR